MLAIFFLIGLVVGSFLGAVNYRIKVAEDIVWKRSHCQHCNAKIKWYDNIPLLSFVILTGRCRGCGEKISWKYPAIELLTGLLYAAIAWKFLGSAAVGLGYSQGPEKIFTAMNAIDMAFWLFSATYLVLIFFHDLSYMLIPDVAVYPAIIVTIIYQYWKYLESSLGIATLKAPITGALFAGLLAAFFFFLLIWISKGKWIGGGDVKLGFLAGLIVGWPKVLAVFFLSYTIGAVVSLLLIALGRKTWKSQIPFGPFIVTGILLVMFFSEQIQFWANRYLNIGY